MKDYEGIHLKPRGSVFNASGEKNPKLIITRAHVGIDTLKSFVEVRIKVSPKRKQQNFDLLDKLSQQFAELLQRGGIVMNGRITALGLVVLTDEMRDRLVTDGIISKPYGEFGCALEVGTPIPKKTQVSALTARIDARVVSSLSKSVGLVHPATNQRISGWFYLARELEQLTKMEFLNSGVRSLFTFGTISTNAFCDELQNLQVSQMPQQEQSQLAAEG